MSTILIESKDRKEEKLLKDLLEKLGVSSRKLATEEREDIGLSQLMRKADRSKKVSREVIMKKLSN